MRAVPTWVDKVHDREKNEQVRLTITFSDTNLKNFTLFIKGWKILMIR